MQDLQSSTAPCYQYRHGRTHFRETETGTGLALQYTADDHARNIRAYVTTLLGTLRCRINIQSSDGCGMVLRYVSSYDVPTNKALYSAHLTGYQAAASFLRTVQPLEPEMFLQLTSIKQAWSSACTKWFVVPMPEEDDGHTVYRKYPRRPAPDTGLSFLQWLRVYNENAATPKWYKTGTSLVALKTVSMFNHVFFYQHLIMHWPHTDSADLHHPRQAALPKAIRYFVQAQQLLTHIWGSDEGVRNHLQPEGHKQHFIKTVVYYLRALHNVYRLWSLRVIPSDISDALLDCTEDLYPLSAQQTRILHQMLDCCDNRDQHLAGALTDGHRPIAANTRGRSTDPRQSKWAKFQVIVGKPGTGKSQVLKRLIHACPTDKKKMAVAAPLAILAIGYCQIFPDSTCDTLHSFFRIPVTADDEHTNFGMAQFDLITIDEASMLDATMFEPIAGTLNKLVKRPVIVIAGDERQQQPLRTAGRTTS